MLAAGNGDGYVEVAKTLIEAGSDLNATDENQYTPLMLAVKSGCVEVTDMLIKAAAMSTLGTRSR